MKKFFLIFLLLLLATPVLADDMMILYQKGLHREGLRAYESAVAAFKEVVTNSLNLLVSPETEESRIREVLPYAIAATYRQAISTHRYIESSAVKLHKQIRLYDEAQRGLQSLLVVISDLEVERGLKINPKQYGLLYYAKAYNNFGFAYTLLSGSLWKRYIVYTPAKAVAMLDLSIKDLKTVRNYYQDNTSFDPFAAKTLLLLLGNTDKNNLAINIKSLIDNSVTKTIALYENPEIKEGLEWGRRVYGFEEFQDPKTKMLFNSFRRLLKEIEIK